MEKILKPSSKIYVGQSKIEHAGRGVFAAEDIKTGDVIEHCLIILLNEDDTAHIRKTELHNYYFMWGTDKTRHKSGICLGFGSIYNHTYTPNATYKKRIEENMIDFVAIKDISKDEEITVNYNYGNPEDKSKLWISSIPSTTQ